ncbi:MAG: hypothetical protein KAX65_11405 [Caldilineaceae bacterium]|nr:hypothetical protein [Caldilineaceae bacterium]
MKGMINKNTSIATIKGWAADDFGVNISDAEAQEIKDAQANGTLMWTARYIIIAGSQFRIERKQ